MLLCMKFLYLEKRVEGKISELSIKSNHSQSPICLYYTPWNKINKLLNGSREACSYPVKLVLTACNVEFNTFSLTSLPCMSIKRSCTIQVQCRVFNQLKQLLPQQLAKLLDTGVSINYLASLAELLQFPHGAKFTA